MAADDASGARPPVVLRIKLRYDDLDTMVQRFATNVGKSGLFLVVSDAFLTETAELADVVLPAALWGEKTGTFTNADRTVHLSLKAIDPPGEARSDLDIFLDFARRMDFRDKDGAPLIKWADAEGAFRHWARSTKGWFWISENPSAAAFSARVG